MSAFAPLLKVEATVRPSGQNAAFDPMRSITLAPGARSMKAAAAILLVGLSTAQAAEPSRVTLACKGTATAGNEKRPVSMDVVVNLTGDVIVGGLAPAYGTVEGF